MKTKINAGIWGASGYGGAELLKILLGHPRVNVLEVTANEAAGRLVADTLPQFFGLTDLRFGAINDLDRLNKLDLVFLCMPHGKSKALVPNLPSHLKVIDLSGDYRIRDHDRYEEYYGSKHESFEFQSKFVYGLCEVYRDKIKEAGYVANPGCFATSVELGLAPLMGQNLIADDFIVCDAKTGSSGSGSKAKKATHHPERSQGFWAYKLLNHQHLPEIEQCLRDADPTWPGHLTLQVHSAPFVRGIFTSIYCRLKDGVDSGHIRKRYEAFFKSSEFVRLRYQASPNVSWVSHTNFTDIGWQVNHTDLVIFVALDNLVKGAAGQAVQNMNIMFHFAEGEGLSGLTNSV